MSVEHNQNNVELLDEAYSLFFSETESLLNQAEMLMQASKSNHEIVELENIVDVMRTMMEIAAMVCVADHALIDLSLTTKLSDKLFSEININRSAAGLEQIQKLKAIRHVLLTDIREYYQATRH